MATYSKTNWATGDLITAEKMNKIETQLETNTPGATGAVRYDTNQSGTLTTAQKTTARTNIDAVSSGDFTTLQTSVTNLDSDLEDLTEEVNDNKADIDGYYTALTAGNAEQLVSTVKKEDTSAYTFRTTGGDVDVGNRREIELVGGSIAWNQLIQSLATTSTNNGVTFTKNSNGSWTLTGTTTSNNAFLNLDFVSSPATNRYQSNHVYYLPKGNTSSKKVGVRIQGLTDINSSAAYSFNSCEGDVIIKMSSTAGSLGLGWARIQINEESNVNIGTVVIWPQIFDLTQMFGQEIADYVYNLEQATPGAGVAWFKNLFPKDYYEYNAGTLMSVKASKAITSGFNQWDEEWEVGRIGSSTGQNADTGYDIRSKNYIPAFPNTDYCIKNSNTVMVFYYDGNKTFIDKTQGLVAGAPTFTTPSNCAYIRFNTLTTSITTYSPDVNPICLNLVWSGYRNGEYEPAQFNTYEFDSSLELRGIPKLDSEGKLYYDGDTYDSDGTVTRRYAVIDMGTLNWDYVENKYFRVTIQALTTKVTSPGLDTFIASNGYTYANGKEIFDGTKDKCLCLNTSYLGGQGKYVNVRDSAYTSAADFKAAMSGVYLVYPIATPTEETAEPYASPQVIDDFGTEEFIDAGVEADTRDVSIPVGNTTYYTANLRDKLQHLPDSTSEDGVYVIEQANKQMKLQKFEGHYANVSVDGATQLLSSTYNEDSVPYNFRTAGGSADIGDRVYEEIVGGTVAWNQLVQNGNFESTSGWTTSSGALAVSNNILTYTPTAFTQSVAINGNVLGTIQGHKYLVRMDAKYNNALPTMDVYVGSGGHQGVMKSVTTLNAWIAIEGIFARETGGNDTIAIYPRTDGMSSGDTINFKNVMCIDLTQMFGSTIADYIYSLETATAGAGVTWFKSLFPNDYYAYNAGELMSVQAARKETTGFNQWDEEWELGTYYLGSKVAGSNNTIRCKNPIRVLPNTTYYYKCPNTADIIEYLDADGRYLSRRTLSPNSTFTIPSDAYSMVFAVSSSYGTTYKNDICINLSWSGYRNGEYEPYTKNTYALDNSLELRGIPKLNASNQLYWDGDTYSSDGVVTRKYDYAELKDLEWTAQSASSVQYFVARPNSTIQINADLLGIIVNCNTYLIDTTNESLPEDGYIKINTNYWGNGQKLTIRDSSISTVNQLKAKIEGAIVSNLTTPTEETAEPYTNPQIVDDFGTEEYVDALVESGDRDVSVPVGHNSKYLVNLRDKLQHLPDLASSNGTYVLSQSNSQLTLTPLTTPTELPAAPTTNGTYKLRCVIANGTPTYSWVADS